MAIVRLACVMMMNWLVPRNSRTRTTNRWVLASSRAASTSSSRQKGLGRHLKKLNSSARAVMVFSPPLSREMERRSLPGGRATISMPLSRTFSGSFSRMSALPPPKSLRNSSLKLARTAWNDSSNLRRDSTLIRLMSSLSCLCEARMSSTWAARNDSRC